jgi:acetoin utilization deacetylase AcuC-like enzyme
MTSRDKDSKLIEDPSITNHDPLSAQLQRPLVGYYYNDSIGDYMMNDLQDSSHHPMKPFRVRMTHELIKSYRLDEYMVDLDMPEHYYEQMDMSTFHSDDYLELLRNLTPENQSEYKD